MTKLQQFADFTNKKIFVGIDVHKKSWSVSLYYEQQYLRTFSQPPSTEALAVFLKREFPQANFTCGYESGFSGFWIQRQLQEKGLTCYVLHPGDIPHTVKHKTAKTDAIDSKSIASALSAGTVSSIYIPDPKTEHDRTILRYRQRLLKDIKRCKNRIKSFLFQFGIPIPDRYERSWSKPFVQWLNDISIEYPTGRLALSRMISQLELLRGSLLQVNKDLRLLQRSTEYKPLMDILTSVSGVGPLTAFTLILEIADINRFSSFRHLNSFVGLYPMEYSSGEHEYKGKITVRRNHFLRDILVEAAWTSIRHDPAMLLAYESWTQRMTAKRAIVKIARKLLSRIRYVWINKTVYVKGVVK